MVKDLFDSGFDDLGDLLPGEEARGPSSDAGHLYLGSFLYQGRQCTAVQGFDPLGLSSRGAQADCNIIRQMVASDRYDRCVRDGPVDEYRHIRRPSADIDQYHSQILFVRGQDGLARCEGLQDNIEDLQSCLVDTLYNILYRGNGPGNYMDLDL